MQNQRDFVAYWRLPSIHTLIRRGLACAMILTLSGMVERSHAQEKLRDSLTGEGSVEGAKSANNQEANFQIGPVKLRTSASLDTAFNDNVNVAKTGRLADFIVTPHGDISGTWNLSEINALKFDLGIGYQIYTVHSGISSLYLSPNSQVQLNIFAGDVKINLHDNFSYEQDPLGVAQLSNISQFSRFLNDAGIEADWDLNDVVLTAAYDHTSFWVFQSAYNYLGYQEDTISPKAVFKLSDTLYAGLATVFGDARYDKNVQNDYTFFSVGPLVTAQLSDSVSVRAQTGAYVADYDHGGLNGDKEDNTTYFVSTGLSHRITDSLTESITAGRESIPGITSNFTDRIYASYNLGYIPSKELNFSSNLWWENLTDSQALVRSTANRFGVDLTLKYNLTEHTSISAGYQFTIKDASPSSLSYYQDLFTLGLSYQF